MNDYYNIHMHNFVYLSLYIISLIKIINKKPFYFFFITPYLLMKEMIWTQAIKSFIILAYYCYLHMHKLQLKKKPQSISSTKVSMVQLFQTVLLEKVEVLKSAIFFLKKK